MESQSIIILTLLVGIFAATVWWHLRENRQLAEFLNRKKLDEATTKWIMRFAWSRTIQLLGAAAFGIIVIVSYDWEYNESVDLLVELSEVLEQRMEADKAREAEMAAQAAAAAAAAAAAPTPSPAAPAQIAVAQPQLLPQPGITPPVQQPLPQQQPVATYSPPAPVTLTAPVNIGADDVLEPLDTQLPMEEEGVLSGGEAEYLAAEREVSTLEQVYNPEQTATGDAQAVMDDIKKRYEDILVIYMFLKQCDRIEPADYNVITSALAQEMAAVNAPGRLQSDIVSAARGSYQEIYSQSPCDGNGIGKLTRQYHQYINILRENFPPE